jgi:hypothetical protein
MGCISFSAEIKVHRTVPEPAGSPTGRRLLAKPLNLQDAITASQGMSRDQIGREQVLRIHILRQLMQYADTDYVKMPI